MGKVYGSKVTRNDEKFSTLVRENNRTWGNFSQGSCQRYNERNV